MPVPGPGQVRIRVAACALNHLDLWVRKGLPGLRRPYPFILGSDVAGTIDALGAGMSGVAEGDEVLINPGLSCGRCRACLSGHDNLCRDYGILGEHSDGGYAEFLVVPAANLLPAPQRLTPVERATFPVTFLTAWQMLVHKVALRPGETVLIHAAGSGVGVAALQIAKVLGAEVIATASSEAKLARARELGADHTLLSGEGLLEGIRRITGKQGVDVVVEHTGAATWSTSILACARGGRIVTCGATSGYEAITDLRHVFYRQIAIFGSTMGSKGDLFPLLDHIAAGRLRPVIDCVLPLAAARQAHERLENRAQFGKIVLTLSLT